MLGFNSRASLNSLFFFLENGAQILMTHLALYVFLSNQMSLEWECASHLYNLLTSVVDGCGVIGYLKMKQFLQSILSKCSASIGKPLFTVISLSFNETVAHCQSSITGLFSSHKKSHIPELPNKMSYSF